MTPAYPRAVTDADIEERKLEILRSAVQAIADRGAEAARLRDIAHIAGVSIGTLQHHFESRDLLITEAFRQGVGDVLSGWEEEAAGLAPFSRIEAFIGRLTDSDGLRERCLLWVEFVGSAARHEETRREFRRASEHRARILGDAIADGRAEGVFLPDLSDTETVELILQQLDGGILNAASGVEPADGARMRDSLLAFVAGVLRYDRRR